MRLKSLFGLAVAIASLGMVAAPQSASAADLGRADRQAGWSHVHTVRHSVYRPRYRHAHVTYEYADPYAYSYTPRGYYPYYNSNYWGPPRIRRFRGGHPPPYYAAWGAPRRDYHHVEWHNRHYGGHRRGDW